MSDETAPLPERRRRGPGDGRTQIVYRGGGKDSWRDAYHFLLTMPLAAFLGVLASAFIGINVLFALVYLATGGIQGARPGDFSDAFFFSVQTLGTQGYGLMGPKTLAANLAATAETFVGLFNLAIATGLMFARISRPTARVMFSDRAVVNSFEGAPTLMFRAANRRRNRIVEAEVTLTLAHDHTTVDGHTIRRFRDLPVLRSRSPLFYLSWQIMHPIDEQSPLAGETTETLAAKGAEILVVLKGLDETFAQTINARTSYAPDDIVWDARLVDIFAMDDEGRRVIDYTHFHDIV
ncbi:MAG: ion channel [Caulobacterales bacterium]